MHNFNNMIVYILYFKSITQLDINLNKIFLGYNGDVMCLQEIQDRVFEYDFFPVFKKTGFDGFYTRKGGRRFEGVATFFRTSKFR